MGIGDEIMASGEAEKLSKIVDQPVGIVEINGYCRTHEVWENNPYIYKPRNNRDVPKYTIRSGPNCRSYLKSISYREGSVFSDWRARDNIGSLFFTDEQKEKAQKTKDYLGDFIVFEPNLVKGSNQNKLWAFDKWQALVTMVAKHFKVVQFISSPGTKKLNFAEYIETKSFMEASAILNVSVGAVLPEGGLHHACGALGKKAVVFFGGFTPPETTGYPFHKNIYHDVKESPCGQWMPCKHCKDFSDGFMSNDMYNAVKEHLIL